MYEVGAVRTERPASRILAPPLFSRLPQLLHLFRRKILGKCDMWMVLVGFVKDQCAFVQVIVHLPELDRALSHLDVDHFRFRENSDAAKLHIECRRRFGYRPYLLAGYHLRPDRQLTRRQYADVGVGVISRNQFAAKFVQERSQGLGNVNYQSVDAGTRAILGAPSIVIQIHAYSMVTIL